MLFRNDCLLLSLIKNQNNEEAKSVIINNDNWYNAVDYTGNTLLHFASVYGNPEIVQFLLDSGSEVDARNDLGQTPLVKTLDSNLPCTKVIEILLGSGADEGATDNQVKNAFDTVSSYEWLTADIRRSEILKLFIEQRDSCIFDVLRQVHKDFIEALLQTNVNLHITNGEGHNLVHILTCNDNPGVMELLHGRNYDVNAYSDEGWTPLMYATIGNNVKAMEFLLNEGADIEATNDYCKRTALYIAIDDDNGGSDEEIKRTVQFLLEHGANTQVVADTNASTIFDLLSISHHQNDLPECVIAHLVLQEARGMTITDLVRSQINTHQHFKIYFEQCQQELAIEIYPSITLLDLLTAAEWKLERYLRHQQLALKLNNFQTKMEYFNTILGKRIPKAMRMVELRKAAVPIVSKLMTLEYQNYPFVIDAIVNCLDEKGMESLMLIRSNL